MNYSKFRLLAFIITLACAFSFEPRADGPLSSGGNHFGRITQPAETHQWTFTGAKNDSVLLSIGEVFESEVDGGFVPSLRLFGPDGEQLLYRWGQAAAFTVATLALSGEHRLEVSSADSGNDGVGAYRLHFAHAPGSFQVAEGDQGGALRNGDNHPGEIHIGDLDLWSFEANKDASVILRIGEVSKSEVDPGFVPAIRLFAPDGAEISYRWGNNAASIEQSLPLTGTYLAVINSVDSGSDATGHYLLHFAHAPGEFIVSGEDEGGPLTNGGRANGNIHRGDLDLWSFEARQGDSIVLSIGEVFTGEIDPGFVPSMRLYGPDGAQALHRWGTDAARMHLQAPLSGAYTVSIASEDSGHDAEGSYTLHFFTAPADFVTEEDDEGGLLENGVRHAGQIDRGDIDAWSFHAHKDDAILVSLSEVFTSEVDPGFVPSVRLYGPDGAEIRHRWGQQVAQSDVLASLSGSHTLLVSSEDSGHDAVGTYHLQLALLPEVFSVQDDQDGGPVPQDAPVEGLIEAGDLDYWLFEADAGNEIFLRLTRLAGDGFVPEMRIYDTQGKLILARWNSSAASGSFTAELAGLHAVVVRSNDSGNDGSGSYELLLEGLPPQGVQLRHTPAATLRTVRLNWPAQFAEHVLQDCPAIEDGDWTDVPETPASNGFNTWIELPIYAQENRYYRLRPRATD